VTTLAFRRITGKDARSFAALRNADDTWNWFFSKRRFTEEEVRRWIASLDPDRDEVYMVEGGGMTVGTCSLYGIDRSKKSAEIGRIIVAAPFRRRGMGSLGLALLHAGSIRENTASRRLFSKCGFVEAAGGSPGAVRYELRAGGGR
jgi:RimJ/RimL family protein N-acetyltransferase